MLCPYCSSTNLIHDFSYGHIVCTSCGSIVDSIFIEFYDVCHKNMKQEFYGLPSVRKSLEKKKSMVNKMRIIEINNDVKIYRKYARKIRKNVYVDLEVALKREQGISRCARIYRHKAEEKIMKILNEDPTMRFILENIVDKDPILSSRTFRGKIAIVLVLKDLIERRSIDIEGIARKTSLSFIHIKRLINLVKKRISFDAINLSLIK